MRDFDRYEESEYLLPRPSILESLLHPCRAFQLAESRAKRQRALALRLGGRVEWAANPKLGEPA